MRFSPARWLRRSRHDPRFPDDTDRGSYTLLACVFVLALLILAGMVYDGGAKLRASQQAASVAEEAARAGVGWVDRDRAYADGKIVVDRAAAIRAASAYLRAGGHQGVVTPTGPQQIQVQVTSSKPTLLLSLIGIGSMQVTRTASADLLSGVEGPGT